MAALNSHKRKLWFSFFQGLLFVIFLIPIAGYAAPSPGAGSSLLVAPETGLFWRREGFQLKTGKTGWTLASPELEEEAGIIRYLRPNSKTGSLAVKTEMLKADLTLENYAKRWMKDYSNYGFELLGSQTFSQNGTKALVVDLLHRKSEQQLRQILFLKNKKAVVLTCKDQQKNFQQTIVGCNQISKSFEWVEMKNNPSILR